LEVRVSVEKGLLGTRISVENGLLETRIPVENANCGHMLRRHTCEEIPPMTSQSPDTVFILYYAHQMVSEADELSSINPRQYEWLQREVIGECGKSSESC